MPNKPLPPPKPAAPTAPKAPSFTQIEAQRSRMFGNSSAPTPSQYDAARGALGQGNGAFRPLSNNYRPLGATPAQLADRIHETQSGDAQVAALEARVLVLETLLSGFARRSIGVCESGVAKTMTIASTAPA